MSEERVENEDLPEFYRIWKVLKEHPGEPNLIPADLAAFLLAWIESQFSLGKDCWS